MESTKLYYIVTYNNSNRTFDTETRRTTLREVFGEYSKVLPDYVKIVNVICLEV